MVFLSRRGVLVSLAVLAGCVRAMPPLDDGAAQASLLKANEAYDAAILAGDTKALEALFAEDFMYVGPDGEVRGKAAQLADLATPTVLEGKSDDVVVRGSGDVAVLTGRFRGKVKVNGEVKDFVERYTTVWRRTANGWILEHEHSSLEPPAAGADAGSP